jgi:Zn-dependent membrane protease YugP
MEPQSIFDLYRRLHNAHGVYDTDCEGAGKLMDKPNPREKAVRLNCSTLKQRAAILQVGAVGLVDQG